MNMTNTNTNNHKTMTVSVLRNTLGDCTNGGVSSIYDRFDVHYDYGTREDLVLDGINDQDLVLIEDMCMGQPRKFLLPAYLLHTSKRVMFGGNFAYTSDSRFPSDAPIKIHDRVENWD